MKKGFVSKALLFDQLTENSEFSQVEKNVEILLNKDQLLASVAAEVSDILNTRSSFSTEDVDNFIENTDDERNLSGIVGLMGLPNMKNVFVADSTNWPDFANKCQMMIRLYEPRLKNPEVAVDSFDNNTQCLKLTISGELESGNLREKVSFEVDKMSED
jgi:type VI secretion system lysozyme-like protein